MYKNGEIEKVMEAFERAVKFSSVYVSSTERAEKVEVDLENGRIGRRYLHNNYYNNGETNEKFIMFMFGYSTGKAAH